MAFWCGVNEEGGHNKWYLIADNDASASQGVIIAFYGAIKPGARGMQTKEYPAGMFFKKIPEKIRKGYQEVKPMEILELLGGFSSLPKNLQAVFEANKPLASAISSQSQSTPPPTPPTPQAPKPAAMPAGITKVGPWSFRGTGIVW